MGDLSENFSRAEFACKCGCGFDTIDAELIKVLEEIRSTFDAPIHITSGCRCEANNKRAGGGANSQHLKGRAADFYISGVSAADVNLHLALTHSNRFGIGKYDNWNHIDTRGGKAARW